MNIKELILGTNLLNGLKNFYTETLEFELSEETTDSFSVNTAETRITFVKSITKENPFYHFAFNIPENQFKEAKEWASSRGADLIKLNGEDEFDFKSWNAHSIYFYDPAGNILELIARHNLQNKSNEKFSGKSLLCISEIGMPVHNIKEFYNELKTNFNLPIFSGDLETFTAVGDDNGLFIIVPDGRNWFPDCPEAKIFPIGVTMSAGKSAAVRFNKMQYKIKSVL